MRVFVYFNLHKKVWSIRALEGPERGLVIGHSVSLLLANPKPKVSQKGRERVLREKCKNVHAGITGELVHKEGEGYFPGFEVTYNPYKYKTFVYKGDETEYKGSSYALMTNKKVFVL